MDRPNFEVELLLGGGITIPFQVPERWVMESRNPSVRAMAKAGDRPDLRMAAFDMVYRATVKNETEPVTVDDGVTSWLIPVRSIVAVRFRDPTETPETVPVERRIGFRFDAPSE